MTDMSAEYLTQRLREVNEKAAKIKSEMGFLAERREQALVAGSVTTSVDLKHQIDLNQEQLEDLEITRAAMEAKLRVYDSHAADAEKIRNKVAERWEGEAKALVDEFREMQSRARVLYGKVLEIDRENGVDENEHRRLVGRDMTGPGKVLATVYQLGAFAGPQAPDVKPLDTWRYVSFEDERARQKAEVEERRRDYEKALAIANEKVPQCPRCSTIDKPVKRQVNLHAGRPESPGQDRNGYWHLICPECGLPTVTHIPETEK